MKSMLTLCVLMALLLQIPAGPAGEGRSNAVAAIAAASQNVPTSRPVVRARGDELAALEQKLLGTWRGHPCAGDYTFSADGSYKLGNYTPGQNTLTGTWSIRWDALPPTLLLTCKTSDFKTKFPHWPEYEYLGKTQEVKLLELNNDRLVYRAPGTEGEWEGARPEK